MRVMLIDPPFYRFMGYYNRYFPYGLVSIATALRRAGHSAVVFNADQEAGASTVDFSNLPGSYPAYLEQLGHKDHSLWGELRETLETLTPDVVGLTCLTPKVASVLRTAEEIKAWRRECFVVVGGPHATAMADELLAVGPEIDVVVVGEGERLMVELIASLAEQRIHPRQVVGPASPMQPEEFGIVDRSLLSVSDVLSSEDMGLVMTSRGCPYRCAYCFSETMWGRRVRRRTAEAVVEEMDSVAGRYGTTQFTFKDDCFTLDRTWVARLCELLLERGRHWVWDCVTRVDLIDRELLELMRKAGCNSIKVGLESGSPRMLRLMDRGQDLDTIHGAAALLRSSGIHWTAYFMTGLPGETEEDAQATVRLMHQVKPDFASLSTYEPLPGTKLFAEGVRSGGVRPAMAREDFFRTLPNRYYLADPQRSGLAAMDRDEFGRLERDMKRDFGRYNRSPRRLLRRGWSRRRLYFREPALLWSDVKRAGAYMRSGS